VEHDGYLCTGVEGVDRKQITGLTLAGDDVTRSAQACAAGAEQDEQCGQELYFGTSKDGRWHCGCVLRGRSCLKERAPEGALFSVLLVSPMLHSGPSPYSYGVSPHPGAESQTEAGPRAALRPGGREKVTSAHSHQVLKELMGASAKEELTKMEEFESQFDPESARAPVPPPQVPPLPPQSQPPQDQLVGMRGGGFCAGSPVIYDGPTTGWEDCRVRCDNHRCSFWSYWHDSFQHRCRLTTGCRRRERDDHHTVSAYRGAQKSMGEDDDQAAGDDGQVQEAAAPEAGQSEVQSAPGSRQNCLSPQGTARKFGASPQGGWHNLGRAESYVGCSNSAGSMGYRNLVYNIGSVAKGRCYGLADDVPDIGQNGCEDAYCWLFGPACESAVSNDEKVQEPTVNRSIRMNIRNVRLNRKSADISNAKDGDIVEAELKATEDAKQAEQMSKEVQEAKQARGKEIEEELSTVLAENDKAHRSSIQMKNLRNVRLNRKSAEISNAKDSDFVKAELKATADAKQAVQMSKEVQEAKQARGKETEEELSTVLAENDKAHRSSIQMNRKRVEISNAKVSDSVQAELKAKEEEIEQRRSDFVKARQRLSDLVNPEQAAQMAEEIQVARQARGRKIEEELGTALAENGKVRADERQ
jgi:hypothetical protein